MDLHKYIIKNPIIPITVACNMIAHECIKENGIPHTSDIKTTIKAVVTQLNNLIEHDKSIFREYRELYPTEANDGFEIIEVCEYHDYRYYCNTDLSVVNFYDLLSKYNLVLQDHGLNQLTTFDQTNSEYSIDSEISIHDCMQLTEAISTVVTLIYNRVEKITNNTFDSIFTESTKHVRLTKLLPEIKESLRKLVDDKITKGRPSTITEKKIQAAIELAETCKGKDQKELSLPATIEKLKKSRFALTKADREEVAEIYLRTRSS